MTTVLALTTLVTVHAAILGANARHRNRNGSAVRARTAPLPVTVRTYVPSVGLDASFPPPIDLAEYRRRRLGLSDHSLSGRTRTRTSG